MAPILKSLSPQSQSIFEKLQPYLKKVQIQPQSKEVLSGMAQYNPWDQSIWYDKDIFKQGNYPNTNTKYVDRAFPHEAAHHLSVNYLTDKEKEQIKKAYQQDLDEFYKKKDLWDKFIRKDAPYYLKNEHEYSAEHLTDALGSQTYPYKPMDKFAKVERWEIFQPIAERFYKPQDGYRVMEGKIRKNVKSSPKILGDLFSKETPTQTWMGTTLPENKNVLEQPPKNDINGSYLDQAKETLNNFKEFWKWVIDTTLDEHIDNIKNKKEEMAKDAIGGITEYNIDKSLQENKNRFKIDELWPTSVALKSANLFLAGLKRIASWATDDKDLLLSQDIDKDIKDMNLLSGTLLKRLQNPKDRDEYFRQINAPNETISHWEWEDKIEIIYEYPSLKDPWGIWGHMGIKAFWTRFDYKPSLLWEKKEDNSLLGGAAQVPEDSQSILWWNSTVHSIPVSKKDLEIIRNNKIKFDEERPDYNFKSSNCADFVLYVLNGTEIWKKLEKSYKKADGMSIPFDFNEALKKISNPSYKINQDTAKSFSNLNFLKK